MGPRRRREGRPGSSARSPEREVTAPQTGLDGRVVLLVGASRGVGRATAVAAARSGARLGLVARSLADVEALAGELTTRYGVIAIGLAADVREAGAVEGAVRAVCRHYGRLDAAIYNPGVAYWEPVSETTEERWEATLATNLTGAFRLTRAVLPIMAKQRSGQLVFVASRLAKEPVARYAAYCAAKAGLLAFADAVAQEVAPHGVRVTTVVPGLVDTTFSDVPKGRPRDQRPPADLMLEPDEVAEQIVNVLLSPSNTWLKEVLVYPAKLWKAGSTQPPP